MSFPGSTTTTLVNTAKKKENIPNDNDATTNKQKNVEQENNLHWESYSFLLLPGLLALFTLVGMQLVICAFWIPKSFAERFRKSCVSLKQIFQCTACVKHNNTQQNGMLPSNSSMMWNTCYGPNSADRKESVEQIVAMPNVNTFINLSYKYNQCPSHGTRFPHIPYTVIPETIIPNQHVAFQQNNAYPHCASYPNEQNVQTSEECFRLQRLGHHSQIKFVV